MQKLEKLSLEQEAHLEVVKNEWLELCNSCPELNEKESKKLINWMYKISGLKEPVIVFLDSPMACQIGCEYALQLMHMKPNQVGNQVLNQVWNQVWNQVGNQVENQVENMVQAAAPKTRNARGRTVKSRDECTSGVAGETSVQDRSTNSGKSSKGVSPPDRKAAKPRRAGG